MNRPRVSMGETFGASVEWTKTLFFKPFSLKRWAIFFIIAMLAFELQGGLNLRLNNTSRGPAKDKTSSTSLARSSARPEGQGAVGGTTAPGKAWSVYKPLFIGLGILALCVILLIWWLRSVFLFIFLEAIANNDASIRRPFTEHRPLGNSYFGWTLLLASLFLVALAIPVKLGYDVIAKLGVLGGANHAPFSSVALAVLPHLIVIAVLLIAAGLASFFMEDYVAIIMFKKRVSLPKAVPEATRLVFHSLSTTIKYIIFKIGLAIAVSIISTVGSFLILITFLAPIVIIGLGLGFLYSIIPAPVRVAFFVILALAGVPVILGVVFIANVAFTPLSFFYRTFNMKFIARLDERYDLFRIV